MTKKSFNEHLQVSSFLFNVMRIKTSPSTREYPATVMSGLDCTHFQLKSNEKFLVREQELQQQIQQGLKTN